MSEELSALKQRIQELEKSESVLRENEYRFRVVREIVFPHIDVFEATRRIKTDHSEIPILIITDLDGELQRNCALSAGADACLTKDRMQMDLIPLMNKLLKQGLKDCGDKGDV